MGQANTVQETARPGRAATARDVGTESGRSASIGNSWAGRDRGAGPGSVVSDMDRNAAGGPAGDGNGGSHSECVTASGDKRASMGPLATTEAAGRYSYASVWEEDSGQGGMAGEPEEQAESSGECLWVYINGTKCGQTYYFLVCRDIFLVPPGQFHNNM